MRPGPLLIRIGALLALSALLVPLLVELAWLLALAVLVVIGLGVAEAVALRRVQFFVDRPSKLALPLDEEEQESVQLRTTARQELQLTVRQLWPELIVVGSAGFQPAGPQASSLLPWRRQDAGGPAGRMPALHASEQRAMIRPGEVLPLTFGVRAIARGTATVGALHVAATMRGLMERIVRVGEETTVHVLPNLRAVGRMHKKLNEYALRSLGARTAPRIGKGREFDRLRDYVTDDDYRDIAWRASARHGRLIVREFRLDRSQDVLLCIDQGHRMAARVEQITRLDHAVNAAVLISYLCNRMEDKIGIVSFDAAVEKGLPTGRGAAHLRAVTAYVSGLQVEARHTDYLGMAASLRRRLHHRTLIVILTVLPEREERYDLLRAVEVLAPQHLPLFVALSDRDLRAQAELLPSNRDELSRALVARDLYTSRVELMRELRARGALVVDSTPVDAGIDAINAYVDVKRRQML